MPTVAELDAEPQKQKWRWPGRAPQTYVLALTAGLFGPVALFAPAQTTTLLALAGGLCLVLNPVSGLGLFRRQAYLIPLAGLLVLGALSGLWAVEGAEVAKRLVRITGLAVAGVLIIAHIRDLPEEDRWLIGKIAVASWVVLAVLFAVERLTGGGLNATLTGKTNPATLNRPSTYLLLMTWMSAGLLFATGRKTMAILAIAATGLLSLGLQAQVTPIAFAAGVVAACLGALAPRLTAFVMSLAIVLAFILLPILAANDAFLTKIAPSVRDFGTSAAHRLLIWNFSADKIAERPISGWGLDSSRRIPGGRQLGVDRAEEIGADWAVTPKFQDGLERMRAMSSHPHSLVLQTWLELGAVGAILMALLLGRIVWLCTTGPPGLRACRFGLIASALVVANISYSAWQSGWLSALFLLACLAAATPTAKPGAGRGKPAAR
ncbi:MAG: O-antigen ligase family protein [Alphaproteobacteria bacterium]|nr:O-antigen ligase family protein [Alphaproteobacteria bacterium]